MSYESVDKLQKLLADTVFDYTKDKKKAAGRALGTFLEIITYYLIKSWKLDVFTVIERSLPEFANSDITHNVEFTLHGSKIITQGLFMDDNFPISARSLLHKHNISLDGKQKSVMLIDKNRTIRNACTLLDKNYSFLNAYIDSIENKYFIFELYKHPFAMFECKRVGVEDGMKKGPQTIEKAKQGSYVARTVSALQRIRKSDGGLAGILQKSEDDFLIDNYYELLNQIISSNNKNLLKNFILTVGVVSNHGNWFTSDNENKELKVLAQSYDWLIFLTDTGISEFIKDLLLTENKEYYSIKQAFEQSYNKNKRANIFTKVKMDYASDIALCNYFEKNSEKIKSWFNIISPKGKTITDLKKDLLVLSKKNWQEVYTE